jgi:hypothetical protein
MPLVPVSHQSWLFSPPLELPLQLRVENGRFDSLRRRELPRVPPCSTTQVIPADDPSNPTGRDVHFSHGLHQAVDLASAAGNCIYAAYRGGVVKVEVQTGRRHGQRQHRPLSMRAGLRQAQRRREPGRLVELLDGQSRRRRPDLKA